MLVPLLVVAALTAGCADESEPVVVRPSEVAAATPSYDARLEPAAAVMAVVPADATVLEVTDFDEIRLALGYGSLNGRSEPAVLRRFWAQAEREAPLLSDGILRAGGTDLGGPGFTQDDVSWEAHFTGPSGAGYVVKFRDGLDMSAVRRATKASGSPLRGATVLSEDHLAAVGATRDPAQSWAAEPELSVLVGGKAGATYVSRDCLTADEAFDGRGPAAAELASLDELGAFSVGFGGTLITARLGAGRPDVFDRARLAGTMERTEPGFEKGYRTPVVGDPSSGRIGFGLGDAPVAARLAHERRLPFAVCSP